ncbi:hypothetical protein [Streptomyces sp. WAC06614]|uniref:hypothetical protein n=1 Tax=Streptomyces sp. WAC06614 TaxID=2487416 RepID=UPI000F78F5C1|nr:hypothetical protein [Streptomyces sp. WAC06614]RSS83830.1 hypothetical protein EF918_02555 [Streptomyces sp. WAC06614]
MRAGTLRRALVTLLAATATAAALIPATATRAAAAPTDCRGPMSGVTAQIYPGQRLEASNRLVDKVSRTELVMQADGNLVLYALGNPGGYNLPLWYSGTYGNPGAYATFQEDGNFVVYRQGGGPQTGGGLWHTATYGTQSGSISATLLGGEFSVFGRASGVAQRWTTGSAERQPYLCTQYVDASQPWWRGNWAQSATVWLVLQRDNNLVMYRKSDGKAIWNSGTYGGPAVSLQMSSLYPGDMTITEYTGDNNGKVRWRTYTHGNAGAWALLQDDGNFVVYKKDGGPGKGGALWNTATYDKI